MQSLINRVAVAALADRRVSWHHKGLPVAWTGRTAAEICAERPDLFGAGPPGPMCVLRAQALEHNLSTMARWCAHHGVEPANPFRMTLGYARVRYAGRGLSA